MAAGGGGAVRATAKEQLERLARLQAELQAMPEDLEVTIQGTGGIEGGVRRGGGGRRRRAQHARAAQAQQAGLRPQPLPGLAPNAPQR